GTDLGDACPGAAVPFGDGEPGDADLPAQQRPDLLLVAAGCRHRGPHVGVLGEQAAYRLGELRADRRTFVRRHRSPSTPTAVAAGGGPYHPTRRPAHASW